MISLITFLVCCANFSAVPAAALLRSRLCLGSTSLHFDVAHPLIAACP